MTQIKNTIEAYQLQPLKLKRNKYRNVKCVVDGLKFDSIHESKVYEYLKAVKKCGALIDFKCQVPYAFMMNNQKICTYIADFVIMFPDRHIETWDAKSPPTRKDKVYKLKKKMMKIFYGIDIREM